MNKLDYCLDKVEELERRFLSLNSTYDPTKVTQYTLSFTDEYFVGEKSVSSPDFYGKMGNPLVFQVKIDLQLMSDSTTDIILSYGGFEVFAEKYMLSSGQQSLFVMQSINCISEVPQPLILKIKTEGETTHKVIRVDYFVWGVAKVSQSNVLLSSSSLNNKLAISMVSNKQLFICEYTGIPDEISIGDLVYKIPAVDASITYNIEDDEEKLHVFRVDSLGNLNHSLYTSLLNEKLIESNVTAICSEVVFDESQILVAYIKNKKPYAKILNKGSLSSEIEIPVPQNAVCNRISIIKNVEHAVMLIVTTDSSANYVCMTQKEISGGIENIKVKFDIEVY